jgi:hypothetical protein
MIGHRVDSFRWTRIPGTGMEVYSYYEYTPIQVFEDGGSLIMATPTTTVVVRKEIE